MKDKNKKLTLKKKERLRGRKNFFFLFKKGKVCQNDFVKVFCISNNLDYNRIVVSVSKKLGNSCFRNYIRRVIKEIYRTNKFLFKQGYDIGFRVLKKEFRDLSFEEKKEKLFYCLRKLALL